MHESGGLQRVIAALPRHHGRGHPVELVVYQSHQSFLGSFASRSNFAEKHRYFFLWFFREAPAMFGEWQNVVTSLRQFAAEQLGRQTLSPANSLPNLGPHDYMRRTALKPVKEFAPFCVKSDKCQKYNGLEAYHMP